MSSNEPPEMSVRSPVSGVVWGANQHGQLGVSTGEEDHAFTPLEIPISGVTSASCGFDHTLLLSDVGAVFSCGNNDFGQLGQTRSLRRYEVLTSLQVHTMRAVAAGMGFSVAVNSAGQVFTWGSNTHGQLGRREEEREPRLVKSLAMMDVIQVSCGSEHTLALCDSGHIFCWGSNSHHQLGTGTAARGADTPTVLSSLRGLPVAQVVAGGYHSICLSMSGALFTWGRNNSGQLGTNDTETKHYPTLVRSLRSQGVVFCAAGEEHTAVLTAEGGVFTFGAGRHGQLGHGSAELEVFPRRIMELMGAPVTQLACGRYHTLCYVASENKLFLFGCGAQGQLAVEPRPDPVSLPRLSVCFKGKKVHRVFSSCGSHCIALMGGARPTDFTRSGHLPSILHMEANRPAPAQNALETIFSSPSCLNASFLTAAPGGCGRNNSGVDLLAARKGWTELLLNRGEEESAVIFRSIEEKLFTQLDSSPPDVEALRLYLILPQCPRFNNPDMFRQLQCPFAFSLSRLEKNANRVLDFWFSQLEDTNFLQFIEAYKRVVLHLTEEGKRLSDSQRQSLESVMLGRGLEVSLKVLHRLYLVNTSRSGPLSYETFYISDIKEKVNIRMDFLKWLSAAAEARRSGHSEVDKLFYCDYPFIFDGETKTQLLHVEGMIQMNWAMHEAQLRFIDSLFHSVSPETPFLLIEVSRDTLVEDTMRQLTTLKPTDLKKPLKISFSGEEADDEGGVKKEFFLLIMKEVMHPKFGMFRSYEDSRLIWFADYALESNVMYLLIGTLCGLAVYNRVIVHLPFPLALFKKLLKRKCSLEDLKELSPTVGSSLQQLLDHSSDDVEEVFCLNFSAPREVFGHVEAVDLIPAGKDLSVTNTNREKYADAYVGYVFNGSVEGPFLAFFRGFHHVCGGQVLDLFQPQELCAMMIGNAQYDWLLLQRLCEYKGDYHANHETIKLFWDVFQQALTAEDRRRFLMFLTGSDRVPIGGMKELKMYIQPTSGGSEYLPVAHTCFNLLDLPRYTSRDILRDKLLHAIQHDLGFSLV